VFILADNGGNLEIWSIGVNEQGVLGQGKEMTSCIGEFKRLDYPSDRIQFTSIEMAKSYVVALTDDHTVYGWGKNEENILCSDANTI
jgi:alpha-tubulin suppressor-like RCC1 family protein